MAISPISPAAISGLPGLPGVQRPTPMPETGATSFGESLGKALDNLAASHAEVDQLAVQAATGDLNAVHDFTIAATEAQLLTQLTVQIRDRAVEAFNDIMRMQV
jgi:flagellar hook-basal body complex protein FliE